MRWVVGLLCLVATGACGDDGSSGPGELMPDPAVSADCLPEPPGAGESRAKWISCTDELPAGRLVSGRVGDILLANEELAVVIRGFGEGYYLMGTAPGGIVDAARHGATDQIKEILPILALNGGGFDELVITEAGDDGPATVVVRGPVAPVPFVASAIFTEEIAAIVEQRYILEPGATEVRIETVLFPDGGTSSVEVGDALFLGGVIDSWAPGRGVLEGSGSIPFVASTGGDSGTSYGIVYPTDDPPAIRFADIANVKLALGPTRTLGNTTPVVRWLVVGDGSAASVTERAWQLRGEELGTVTGTTAPGVDVRVRDADDDDITVGRADASGSYRIALPAASYSLTAESPGRAAGTASSVTITAGGEQTADLTAGGSGTLALTVRDGDGAAIPARVVLRSEAGRRIEYAGADGTLTLPLPPGDYTLDVSRGMEYTAFTVDPLTIADGAQNDVAATLDRVVDTAGWISVDTHLHSEMSTDSQIPLDARLLAVAAEGVEVPISTDHDFVTNYDPVVAELGLTGVIAPQVGVEASHIIWGHVNAWPLTPDYDRGAGHAFPWYERSPGQVFDQMRERGDHVVIQLNHPRDGSSALFDRIDLNPVTLIPEADPEDLNLPPETDLADFDFDALEIANDFNQDAFDAGLRDWLALVAAGHPAVATGSSDSHGRSAYAGNSRTYVYVGDSADDPSTITGDAVNDALRAGKAVVAQGAFVTAAIVAPGGGPLAPGQVAELDGETEATLAIRVQAPPWMPLARIVVYAGTEMATTIGLDSGETAVVRYDDQVTIPIAGGDGFFVVLVEAAGPGSPVLGTPSGSFTNALLYDGDGDGLYRP